MLRRYRHIIWDWNGTLLDDLDLCIDIMNELLRARQLPILDRARYHAVFDFPVRDYYQRVGLDVSEQSFRALSVEFIARYDARRFEAALHPGAESLLGAIAARRLTQSILSAYRHETLCEIVAHFGLTSRFTRLTGLDNIYAHSKAELGRTCLAELRVAPREVLMIGDTLHDLDVAKEIGIDCILVAHGHHSAERLRTRSEHVYDDLRALAKALEASAESTEPTHPSTFS
jgi:phosphoglycolate phosphatase